MTDIPPRVTRMNVIALQTLGEVSVAIPAWQMALLVGMMSVFTLFGRLKLSILVTYVFVLYWGFLVYAPTFIDAAGTSTLAFITYIVCGLAIIVLAITTFFVP